MKAPVFVLSVACMLLSSPLVAFEAMHADEGAEKIFNVDKIIVKNNDLQSEAKVAYLSKLMEQQHKLYESKISYLEFELKKSKERLVEKSINSEKTQDFLETKYAEETNFLKRELVAKTKTMLEYQRQLEKIKPSEDFKTLIKVNTDLAIEVRRNADQLALIQLKREEERSDRTSGRMPASLAK